MVSLQWQNAGSNMTINIHRQDTHILSTNLCYTDHIIMEVTQIELHPNNTASEDGLILSGSQKLIQRKKHPKDD
jgi:hypothetical protein